MRWRSFLPFKEVDETIHHFHRMTIALTLVGTMSLQAAITSYLGPIKDIWYSFILTFPLTTGLTIIFLVIYHLNWKKVRFLDVIACPALFAILFLVLNGFSSVFKLPQYAEQIKLKQDTLEQIQRTADSLMYPKAYVEEAIRKKRAEDSIWQLRIEAERNSVNHLKENLDNAVKSYGDPSSNAHQISEAPWYLKIFLPITVPCKILYDEFLKFYLFYGPPRFWSGVALAFIFTLYIEFLRKEAKKRFGKTKEEEG
jgi:hypothetical protein